MVQRMLVSVLLFCASLPAFSANKIQHPQKSLTTNERQQADLILDQLPDEIKTVNEPVLRAFLRLRLASFLWNNETNTSSPKSPENLLLEGVADLTAFKDEIPSMYLARFRREFMALAELHSPETSKRLKETYAKELYPTDEDSDRDKLSIAASMLNDKTGLTPAVELVRRTINSGQDPGPALLAFLQRLRNEKPSAVPELLAAILSVEEQKPGSISFDTFYWLSSSYLESGISGDLRTRFARLAVDAVEREQRTSSDEQLMQAYQLLSQVLPLAERSLPVQSAQALRLRSAIRGRLPKPVLERMTVEANIRQSSDPLKQMMIEAEFTKDESLKDDLLTDAANLALEKKQLGLAVQLAASTSDEGAHGMWRDQFLGDAASRALKEKDVETAERAIAKIKGRLSKATALQRIASYFSDAKNQSRAREAMDEALKLIYIEDDGPQKIRSLLSICTVALKIDELRVTEIVLSAIRIMNGLPQPRLDEKGNSESRKNYVQTLTQVAWNTLPAFQAIAQEDDIGALSMATNIQNRGIRTAAIMGVSTGVILSSKRDLQK